MPPTDSNSIIASCIQIPPLQPKSTSTSTPSKPFFVLLVLVFPSTIPRTTNCFFLLPINQLGAMTKHPFSSFPHRTLRACNMTFPIADAPLPLALPLILPAEALALAPVPPPPPPLTLTFPPVPPPPLMLCTLLTSAETKSPSQSIDLINNASALVRIRCTPSDMCIPVNGSDACMVVLMAPPAEESLFMTFRLKLIFHFWLVMDVTRPMIGSPVCGLYGPLGGVICINLLVRVIVPVVDDMR
mmetsp:Transcript_3001/g.4370  ORF Transcript_3001/g.4370 Transcript_3001/m.4370 type:complete len:243 (+) Transcript_3001:323-1051(+)